MTHYKLEVIINRCAPTVLTILDVSHQQFNFIFHDIQRNESQRKSFQTQLLNSIKMICFLQMADCDLSENKLFICYVQLGDFIV